MNKVTISRCEKSDYKRFAIKEEVKITDETKYIKYVNKGYNKIQEMYNSKKEMIGIDIVKEDDSIEEVIYKKGERKIIVILTNFRGKKFKGVAKCHKDDVFNNQVGYWIAKAKAEIKRQEENLKEYK